MVFAQQSEKLIGQPRGQRVNLRLRLSSSCRQGALISGRGNAPREDGMWRFWYEIKQWWMLSVGFITVAAAAFTFDAIQSNSEPTEYEVRQAFVRAALQECVREQIRRIPDEDFILPDRAEGVIKSVTQFTDSCQKRVSPAASSASPH